MSGFHFLLLAVSVLLNSHPSRTVNGLNCYKDNKSTSCKDSETNCKITYKFAMFNSEDLKTPRIDEQTGCSSERLPQDNCQMRGVPFIVSSVDCYCDDDLCNTRDATDIFRLAAGMASHWFYVYAALYTVTVASAGFAITLGIFAWHECCCFKPGNEDEDEDEGETDNETDNESDNDNDKDNDNDNDNDKNKDNDDGNE